MKKIILASQSPWRKKLLSWLDLDFEVMVSDFNERSVKMADPRKLVKFLAKKKAELVVEKMSEGIVIAADTMIILPEDENEIIGKPGDMSEAKEILLKLKGREHVVLTGVCVIDVKRNKKLVGLEETRVEFGNFSDEDLNGYLKTGDSIGKAGAYQFIKIADKFIKKYEGSVSSVIGLPVKMTLEMLKKLGVDFDVDNQKIMLKQIGYED